MESLHKCGCGAQLDRKLVSKHFGECKIMKQRYSKLFMQVDEELIKQAKSIQDWQNIQVIFDFLHHHIGQMITREQKNPTKFKSDDSKKEVSRSH